jgi:hypothetical protein
MGSNRPHVVKLEIIMLNAINVLIDQGFTIEEIIRELGIPDSIVNQFDLIVAYKVINEYKGGE